jgi:hypothetical protein
VQISISPQAQDPSGRARAVAAELPPLGLPIFARFFIDRQALRVTLGGCDHDDNVRTPNALEIELRQIYQSC